MFPVAGAAVVTIFLFYLEGRGRWRAVFHALLLTIHLPISLYVGYLVWTHGRDIMFQGDTWGWRLPLWALLVPFFGFLCLSVVLVVRERKGARPPVVGWRAIDHRGLVLAIALTPVIALTFGSGDEFDVRAKAATALAVVQWLVLISSVQATSTREGEPPLTPARGR